jgi:hypothetical protein
MMPVAWTVTDIRAQVVSQSQSLQSGSTPQKATFACCVGFLRPCARGAGCNRRDHLVESSAPPTAVLTPRGDHAGSCSVTVSQSIELAVCVTPTEITAATWLRQAARRLSTADCGAYHGNSSNSQTR